MATIASGLGDSGPLAVDRLYGGLGSISGHVRVGIQPVSRQVRLYDLLTGRLVRSTWSGADGQYAFTHLSTVPVFLVVADDHTGIYNDVCAARVQAA